MTNENLNENNLFISEESLSNILDSYNILVSKINYIAEKILGIRHDLDRWVIDGNSIDLEWTGRCFGENYTEYDSFPVYFLTINSYQELKDAWKKVKDERVEYTRKIEEERKRKEKEEQEKKEKALYEELKAKYGE